MKVTSKIVEARKGGNGKKRVMMAPGHHPQTPKNTPTNSIAKQTRIFKKIKIKIIYIYIMNVFFLLGFFLLPCF
jgi:hypothetical protein